MCLEIILTRVYKFCVLQTINPYETKIYEYSLRSFYDIGKLYDIVKLSLFKVNYSYYLSKYQKLDL